MKKNNLVLDYKLVFLTIIALALLMPVFSIIHEMGHGVVCFVNGSDFTWGIDPLGGGWLSCSETFEDPTMFRLAGGIVSALTASTIFILVRPHLRKNTVCITISLASIAATEYIITLLEVFANDFYMNSPFASVISGIVTVVIIIWYIFRISQKRRMSQIEI